MRQKLAPRNTAQEVRNSPILGLVTAMNEGGVEAQEAQGQRSFVGSDTLPSNMGYSNEYSPKEILEAAGVKFFGPVEGDEMFQYVELPKGWQKKPTDHSMWSKLVDDKGRERGSIFYKAAFYDRSSHMSLSTRYGVQHDYNREKEGIAVAHVTDGGKVIYTTELIQLPTDERKKYEVSRQADAAAVAWLDKNHPDWRNPGAYWD